MVLQYSNNESNISIGESVRDEDGAALLDPPLRSFHADEYVQSSFSSRLNLAT